MLKVGDRIEMVEMPLDPDPVAAGSIGTVHDVYVFGDGLDAWEQVWVAWDSGRKLALAVPPDVVRVIS
ncbi:hypothetical protein LCGC14_1184810 [marine sediment metagenome]|uniref:DUF4314 domain-containing protein n=1 Tax=marine sediment metagenome TaxID=412755 RepID=A0A0F9P419_9ZZZZ